MAGIFVSYRRGETTAYAGWLRDRLSEHFGEHRVFRDIDSIEPGFDFVEALQRAVGRSEVLLAVIGRSWITAMGETGRPRLDDPYDYVRMEISAALNRNIRVIPVLVQGASMPRADELPNDLAALARRSAIELHDTNWESDVHHLISTLESVVSSDETGPPTAAYGAIRVKRPHKTLDQVLGILFGVVDIEVYLDGKKVGEARNGESVYFEAPTGEHRVRVRPKPVWLSGPTPDKADKDAAELTVYISSGKVVNLFCGVPWSGQLLLRQEG